MPTNKKNSIKGLILIIIILGAIITYFCIKISKDNFTLNVEVFGEKVLPNTSVTLNNKIWVTDPEGKVKIHLKVKEDEKLIIKTQNDKYLERNDTILVNKSRYLTRYANLIVSLKHK